jgi:putative transposase
MKRQLSFLLPKYSKEHGGSLAIRKRRSRRALSIKCSHHVTLKSHHAVGGRCLLRHRKIIISTMKKASWLFKVRVYEYAVASNHLHLLVKGPDRESIQNFFRVFAGHTAQRILKLHPLLGGAPQPLIGCKKNQRKFWGYLIYSRVVTWGREYSAVRRYIERNTLEALQLIAYRPRTVKRGKNKYANSS